MNLRERVVRGFAWSAVEKWGTQALSFLVFWILARLLDPEAFGLVALTTVFTSFIRIFLDQGFSEAIIQRDIVEPIHLDTAFWVNIIAGSVFAILTVLFAPLIATFFKTPELTPIIRWLSLVFIFVALSSTQQAVLRRSLDFRSLATRTLIARLVGGFVGIICALLGFGAWSLVAQNIFGAFVGVLVLWRVSDWRPGLRFSKRHFAELFQFGVNILGGKILGFFSAKMDNFLIGYFLGATQLGYYTIAYSLLERIIQLFQGVSAAVTLPTFSRLQNQSEKLHQAFFGITEFTALIAFPVFIGLIVIAPEFVIGLFGEQWEASIPIVRVLSLVGMLMSVSNYIGQLITASGRPDQLLILQIVATLVRVIGFLLVVNQGIIAVAWVFVISTYIIVPFYLWVANRLIALSVRSYLKHLVVPVFASILMALIISILRYFLDSYFGGVFSKLGVYITFGCLLYVMIIYLLKPSSMREIPGFVNTIFAKE